MSILDDIPGVHFAYIGIIVGLLVAGGVAWRIHDAHEQTIGAQARAAADAKLAKVVALHNIALKNAADDKAAAVETQYEHDLQTIPGPAPSVVCHRAVANSNGVPAATGGHSGPSQSAQSGVPAADNGSGDSFDVGPPLIKIGHDKDAQIKALEADIDILLAEMQGSTPDAKP